MDDRAELIAQMIDVWFPANDYPDGAFHKFLDVFCTEDRDVDIDRAIKIVVARRRAGIMPTRWPLN